MLLILRKLLRRPRRTVLSLLGVALGAATYMSLLAAGQGLLTRFQESAKILGADLVIQQQDVTSPWHSTIPPGVFEKASELPGITAAGRMILGKTRMPGTPYFLIFGINADNPILDQLSAGLEGRLIDDPSSHDEILVGKAAARHLDLQLGELIDIRSRRFEIVGLYETGHLLLDNGAVIDLDPARSLFGADVDSNLIFLKLADPELVSGTLDRINRSFPGVVAFPTTRWLESYGQIKAIRGFSRFLALIALIIAMAGVSNVLHISVWEGRQEFAILRAVGWSGWSVASLVLSEGFSLGLLGGLAGIPLAKVLLITVPLVDVGGYAASGLVSSVLPPGVVLEGLLVSVLAGGIGSLVPLIRVLRLQPAEVLRSL